MNCPICSSSMDVINHSGVTLDQCTNCKALWFDRTEFATAMERDVPSVSIQWGKSVKDHAGAVHNCPRDRTPMKPMIWGDGIPFDRCPTCSGLLLTEASWNAAHAEAQVRAAGSKFSVVEVFRDLFNV